MSKLPQEILDVIVDAFDGDTDTLQALSLVCSLFLPRSRYNLFKHLRLYINVPRRVNRYDFASAGPMLTYVRHLTIDGSRMEHVRQLDLRLQDTTLIEEKLWTFIQRMPNLDRLTLTHVVCGDYEPSILAQTPSVTHLTLSHCMVDTQGLLLSWLALFPSLQSFCAGSLRVPQCSAFHLPSSLSKLTELCVDAGSIAYLLPLFYSSPLRSFSVRPGYGRIMPPGVSELLKHAGNNLQHLLLHVSGEMRGDCFDVSSNTSLRTLTFRGQLRLPDISVHDIISRVSSPDLQAISLQHLGKDSVQPDAHWEQLDMILSQPQFASLERLCMEVLDKEGLLGMSAALPRCAARGILRAVGRYQIQG